MSLTAQQLAERAEGLGASDCAPAVGLSRWKTSFQLYLEKIGQAPPANDDETLFKEMGEALEPVALSRFTKRTHFQVSDRQKKVVDPNWSRRWVSLDGLSSDGGLIEAKSCGFADPEEWGDELEDDAIPMHYLMQVQHGLACTGLQHAWMPLIISNRQFRLYRIKRDEELIELLTAREREFWTRVEARDPPAPVNLEDVKLRWPSHVAKRVQATEEVAVALAEHRAIKERIKAAEIEEERLKLIVQQHMGDAAELVDVSGNVLCTWKQAKASQVFDEKKFAADNPAVYSRYLFDRPGSRRFLNKL